MIQPWRQLPLWAGALLLVLAGHALLAAIALGWRSAAPVTAPSEAAIAITLAPLPVVTAPPAEPAIARPAPVAKPAPPAPKPAPQPLKTVKPMPARPAVKAQPAPPQPSPPAPPAATTVSASSVSAPSQAAITWQSRLLTHLARHKRYPEAARRRGVEGSNALKLVIDGNGQVVRFALVNASGSDWLDKATEHMIQRAQPLPPPPAELLEEGRVEVVAPVSYSLGKR